MADIPKINQRQKIVNADGTIDRDFSLLINKISEYINENSQAGVTAKRPTENLYVGRKFFDVTIGDEIYIRSLNPTVWVKGGGTVV